MEYMKKRKVEENGAVSEPPFLPRLSLEEARKILEPFTREQLFNIAQNAVVRHSDVLDAVRSIADGDTTQRKLFIRGLGWETTADKLRAVFSGFGELEEAVVILDKATGKSRGFGFITFRHIDGALLALKEPSKQIDGRMTVTQLASAGMQGGPGGGSSSNPVDISLRKIYVGNVPYDMPADRLLQIFAVYGEIEEGPLGFDKVSGKSKGYALFVYKTAEAARASVMEPVKNIDGKQLNCKIAIDGKKGKSAASGTGGAQGQREGVGNGNGMGMHNGMGAQHGGIPSGPGGFPGAMTAHAHNSTFNAGGGSGVNMSGNQVGIGGGPGPGPGPGPYNRLHFGAGGSTGYAGFNPTPTGGLGGNANGYGAPAAGNGLSNVRGLSSYGLPQSSAGMPSGDYPPQGMHHNFPGNQNRQNPPSGAPPVPRVMPGGLYRGMPSYY